MRISIIIPAHNVEKYLRRCLDSAINQTWKDIEIIVVDDASTDKTFDIINEYERNYPNIIKTVYLKENVAAGGARNKGLELATGEYITYLDADDYLDSSMCELMINVAAQENSDIVFCDAYRYIEATGRKTWISYQHREEMGAASKESHLIHFLNYGFPWGKLIRRSLLVDNKITFPEKRRYEDVGYIPLVTLYAEKTSYVQKPLYYYAIREGSTMTMRNVSHHRDILETGRYFCEELAARGFGAYEKIMNALVHYKAMSLEINQNDEPDAEYLYSLGQEIASFYDVSLRQKYAFHDILEVEIAEAAKKPKNDFIKELQSGVLSESGLEYHKYYKCFQKDIESLFSKYENCNIALWGYGKKGKAFLDVLHKLGIGVSYVIDKNEKLHGTTADTGEVIVPYGEVYDKIDVVIVMNGNFYSAIDQEVKALNQKIALVNIDYMFRYNGIHGSL